MSQKKHYCNWKLKSHLFSPLVLTVTTKTGVLLLKLTFVISVKGHVREHQLLESAATQTAEAGEIICYRENVSHLLLRLSYLSGAPYVLQTLSPAASLPPPLVKMFKSTHTVLALFHAFIFQVPPCVLGKLEVLRP